MIRFTPHENESTCDFLNRAAHLHQFVNSGYRFSENDIKNKLPNCHFALTKAELDDILSFWYKYLPAKRINEFVDTRWFDVYASIAPKGADLKYYIPEDFYYGFVDEFYTNPRRASGIDDKNLYDIIFFDVNKPVTLFRLLGDNLYNARYEIITDIEAFEICKSQKEVVLKTAYNSCGGKGVEFVNTRDISFEDFKDTIKRSKFNVNNARARNELVCEKPIEQNATLAKINASSINTIRIMTFCNADGSIVPLSSILRMGRNGSRVDNASSGGIFVGIDENGVTKDVAYDTSFIRYTTHPNGTRFDNVAIPNYGKMVDLAKKLAMRFSSASRLISWDFACSKHAKPILIEMNICYGEVDFHQACNGPLFGDRLPEILDELSAHSFTFINAVK